MLNIGPQELLLILVVALVVVGPERLPELGRTIGKALRSLRSAQDEMRRTVNEVLEPPMIREATREVRGAGEAVREAFSGDAEARPARRPDDGSRSPENRPGTDVPPAEEG